MNRDLTKCRISYPVLDPALREFRLLRLKACEAKIGCELRAFSLDDPTTKWVALSYRWGDDEAIHPVQVNGETLLVHTNLYRFLRQLARGIPAILNVEWVFIDAICIDQSSSSERAAQVLLMHNIYANASLVICWLESEVESDRSSMAIVLADPYWTRLWIVQEILLAQRVIFVIGQRSFTRHDISRFLDRKFGGRFGKAGKCLGAGLGMLASSSRALHELDFEQPHEPLVAATIITQCLKLTSANPIRDERLAFCDAITLFSAQRCRVAHDKIYALLGIAACHFAPDYELPLLELYIQALANFLLSTGYDKASSTAPLVPFIEANQNAIYLHPLFHVFDINPYDLAVAIVTRNVISFFRSKNALTLYMSLHHEWLHRRIGSRTVGPTEIRLGDRTWYVPQRKPEESDSRHDFMITCEFALHMWKEIQELRTERTVVRSPEGNIARTVDEWETLALGHCEEVWEAHLKGEGRKTLLEEREAEYMSSGGKLKRSMQSLRAWFSRGARSNK